MTTYSVPSHTSMLPGYGRARLWLGISAVGTIVSAGSLALALDAPAQLAAALPVGIEGDLALFAILLLAYALIQLPADILGGFLLPARYGRPHPTLPRFAAMLARAVTVQLVMLATISLMLLAAARIAGIPGVIGTAVVITLLMLALRARIAAALAPLQTVARQTDAGRGLPISVLRSSEPSFTGGITGVMTPGTSIMPEHWRTTLGDDAYRIALQRRELAVTTGGWRRGRIVALLFTWSGIAVSAALVGSDAIASAAGIAQMSLFFTLWSFLGLLVLPTLSRAGVADIDDRLRRQGADETEIQQVAQQLDQLQDDEPVRPTIVETIFHPVPSVERRSPRGEQRPVTGFWDVARTSIFISAAGLGLLGRAVHCNCGKPALWAFLPTD